MGQGANVEQISRAAETSFGAATSACYHGRECRSAVGGGLTSLRSGLLINSPIYSGRDEQNNAPATQRSY